MSAPVKVKFSKSFSIEFKLLKEKFPESEGYKVEVTYWEYVGHFVSHRLLEEEIK